MGVATSFFLAMAVLSPAGLPPPPKPGPSPANDDFADAHSLAGLSGRVSATNIDATAEPGEPLIADVPGGLSVWWRWVAPRTGAVTVHTLGSDFDTLLGVYLGTAVGALELVAENDDADSGDGESLVSFQAVGGTIYHFAVDGFEGESGAILLTWISGRPANDDFAGAELVEGPSGRARGTNFGATLEAGEPLIAGGPGGHSVWWGWTAPRTEDVTVHTFGSDFDTLLGVYVGTSLRSLNLVGENDDASAGVHSLVTFQAVAGTLYHFAVDGLDGESGSIVLGWSSGKPANDDFAGAELVEGPAGRATGTNFGATTEAGEPLIGGETGGHSVWWQWVAPRTGSVTVYTFGSSFDTLLGAYTGSDLAALELVAEDDDTGDLGESLVDFQAVAGTLYHLAVDGLDGDSGNIALTWFQDSGGPPANDLFANRARIEGTEGVALASNLEATREADEPNHAQADGFNSVWWSWVAPANGTAEFSTLGSTFDTVLAVYTGGTLRSLAPAGENDDRGFNDEVTSAVTIPVAGGREYQVAVDGFDGEAGLVALSWSFAPEMEAVPRFLRGDCDGNGDATGQVTDAIVLLSYNFVAGREPPCLAACDADGDGRVTGVVTDAIYLLNFNFRAGPPPVAPFPACGPGGRESDLTLGCDRPPAGCE